MKTHDADFDNIKKKPYIRLKLISNLSIVLFLLFLMRMLINIAVKSLAF